MKFFLVTIICLLTLGYAWGQSTTMPSDAINLKSGALFIKNGCYAVGATTNTSIAHSGAYNIYTSSAAANALTMEAGAGILDFNFWNLTISSSSVWFKSSTSADINMYFNGTNTTNQFILYAATNSLKWTFNGDSLTINGVSSQGISASSSLSSTLTSNMNININLNYMVVTTISSPYNSIGYTNPVGKVNVGDGSVLTVTGRIMAQKTVIGKASVKITSTYYSTPVNSNGDLIYCVTVPGNGTHEVMVKNNTSETSETYTFTCNHPNDDNYYLYLPNGSYTLTSNGTDYKAEVKGAAVTASLDVKVGDGNIDVSKGTAIISDGSYVVGSQPYIYSGKVYTFSGKSLANTVTINDGADTVKLNGLDIESSVGCAFNINTGKDLALVLMSGTSNTLVSAGTNYAGLQKSKTDGMLTIKGEGKLNASGSGGAGIGSSNSSSFANLTIESGIIVASTSAASTGAIGCYNNTCSNIFIKGGDITANTSYQAYAIGCFYASTMSNICISGGKVQLYSGNNGKNYLIPPNCVITGGTISGKVKLGSTGALIGNGCMITGGSVNFADVNDNFSIDTHPTNGTTTDYLYRSQFLIPGITSATAVSSITVDGNAWGCKDLFTNETGMVYLWLPKDNASAYETTKVTITAGDKTYTYVGQVDALDNIVTATASVAAQGNYFYQVPVSITSSHAAVTVADAEGNSISDGSFIGSGILDDNKPRLAVTATADEGYNTPVVSVTNLEKGSKYYKVTASENQSVSIDASASIQTFPITFQATHGTASVVVADTSVLSGEWLNYGTLVSISTTPDEHYQFDSLLVNGTKITDGAFTLTSAATITAYCSLLQFPVTIVGDNGVVVVKAGETSISSGISVGFGTVLSISTTPNTGYRLDSLMVNGQKVTQNTYTLTDKITISAAFSKISTGTVSLSESITQVFASGNAIFIKAATGSNVVIYSLSGRLMASSIVDNSLQSFVMPSGGLYLVKVSSADKVKITKCMVK